MPSPTLAASLYGAYVGARRRWAGFQANVPSAPGPFEPSVVKRALLVCTGLLGDTVMCLPAMADARRLLPNARITGLVTPRSHSLLSLTDVFDDFVICDGSPFGFRSAIRGSAAEVRRRLALSRFDLAVIFLGDDYASILARLRIPHRVCVAESALGTLGTVTYSIGHARTWGPEERLRSWLSLGLAPEYRWPKVRIPQESVESARYELGVLRTSRFVVVHPFGRTEDQWWPQPAVEKLAAMLWDALRIGTVIVGGPEYRGVATDRIPKGRGLNLVGTLELSETLQVMACAVAVVSTDSGPVHLAGLLGRPGVGLFRASRSEHAARYPSIEALVAPALAECSGCRWDRCRFSPCRQMKAIMPETVFDFLLARVQHP